MRWPGLILCAILFSLELSGCVAYYTFMDVSWVDQPRSDFLGRSYTASPSVLTDAEVAAAADVIGEVAHQFGLSGSTDMTALRDCSGSTESACNSRVIGFYHAYRPHGETAAVVTLSILLFKSTGRISIFIWDHGSLGATSYTTKLAESIKAALEERLPADQVEIHGHYYWPALVGF